MWTQRNSGPKHETKQKYCWGAGTLINTFFPQVECTGHTLQQCKEWNPMQCQGQIWFLPALLPACRRQRGHLADKVCSGTICRRQTPLHCINLSHLIQKHSLLEMRQTAWASNVVKSWHSIFSPQNVKVWILPLGLIYPINHQSILTCHYKYTTSWSCTATEEMQFKGMPFTWRSAYFTAYKIWNWLFTCAHAYALALPLEDCLAVLQFLKLHACLLCYQLCSVWVVKYWKLNGSLIDSFYNDLHWRTRRNTTTDNWQHLHANHTQKYYFYTSASIAVSMRAFCIFKLNTHAADTSTQLLYDVVWASYTCQTFTTVMFK